MSGAKNHTRSPNLMIGCSDMRLLIEGKDELELARADTTLLVRTSPCVNPCPIVC